MDGAAVRWSQAHPGAEQSRVESFCALCTLRDLHRAHHLVPNSASVLVAQGAFSGPPGDSGGSL